MSTLTEIEEAIDRLPPPQVEKLAVWLQGRRLKSVEAQAPEPDFLSRAKAVWGDHPVGKPLSELVTEVRG